MRNIAYFIAHFVSLTPCFSKVFAGAPGISTVSTVFGSPRSAHLQSPIFNLQSP